MNNVPIWRYLTLAKYVDLLRTGSLYFPKASSFKGETEGKWWGHAHLYPNAQHWAQSPANRQTLEHLLTKAGDDPTAITREIHQILPSANQWVGNISRRALHVPPNKRRENLESVISSWKKHYSNHNTEVTQWKSDLDVYRESTYISCWNRASSMSLAMWEMYGGGTESVAVRSTSDKLQAVIQRHSVVLEEYGLSGALAEVEYL